MRLFNNVQRGRSCFSIPLGRILMSVTLLLALAEIATAAGIPKTVAEIALYQGPDREKILIEGAKKEGQLTIYDSHTGIKTVAGEFEKKYPFIKVSEWRTESREVFKKITEEYKAGRFLVDVVETTDLMVFLVKEGILLEYYSPHLPYYGNEYQKKGKVGVYYLADREIYIGLGFNTERVPQGEAPKSLKDLLDPKWKGKMAITGSKTGISWLGNALDTMGREYVEKLGHQDIKVQNISGAALAGLVASGEVPLSPSIFRDNIFVAKKKGAPVAWLPLEPAVTNIGASGMAVRGPHPHAALLFLDYIHSREGQQVVMKSGPNSPRSDMGSPETNFKKTIFETKYSPEEFAKKFAEWENLSKRLFMRSK